MKTEAPRPNPYKMQFFVDARRCHGQYQYVRMYIRFCCYENADFGIDSFGSSINKLHGAGTAYTMEKQKVVRDRCKSTV